jgi:hypothetical protein
MAMLEREAARLARIATDYNYASASLIGGGDMAKLVVRDERFGLDYEIASHHDFWDFIGAVVDHRPYAALPMSSPAA